MKKKENEMSAERVKIGDKVRCRVTGYTGIAVAETQWLHGCRRILIQAPVDKDGKVPDSLQIDEPQCEILVEEAQPKGDAKTGGPAPKPTQAKI